MRIAALICLTLCFLLFGGAKAVYPDYYSGKNHSLPVYNTKYTKPSPAQTSNHGHQVSENTGLNKDVEYLISLEESAEDSFVKKYISPANYFIYFALIFGYLFSYFRYRLPFCKHLSFLSSYKYLTQRVLRI